jgi:hypothetical protein
MPSAFLVGSRPRKLELSARSRMVSESRAGGTIVLAQGGFRVASRPVCNRVINSSKSSARWTRRPRLCHRLTCELPRLPAGCSRGRVMILHNCQQQGACLNCKNVHGFEKDLGQYPIGQWCNALVLPCCAVDYLSRELSEC